MIEQRAAVNRAGFAATLRGDDALSRAARDIAAPNRRLLAELRDARMDTSSRIAALRQCEARIVRDQAADTPCVLFLRRLQGEAEEQLRRLEILLAQLRERPGNGSAKAAVDLTLIATAPATGHERSLLEVLRTEELRGAQDAARLRVLAHVAGHHLAARLLDLTAQERMATATDIGKALAS